MEHWLTKPRVLLGLGLVLLAAALNRKDPLAYGLFLFLVALGGLGYALPWAALRRIGVRASGSGEVTEDRPSGLRLSLEQAGWWPVLMVEVETCWSWAGRQIVLHHTVPLLRRGRTREIGAEIRFPCRGDYRLRELRLASGFPLGLFTARRHLAFPDVGFVVLPKAATVELPSDLPVAFDEQGAQLMRRFGGSQELGALRDYEIGDPLGRIHWRASARAGHLVIQHHLQSGSPLIRLVTELPDAADAGLPDAPAEQAVRAAAGWAQRALAAGLRVRAYLPGAAKPLARLADILRALATAQPGSLPLTEAIARAACELQEGEQLVVVVSLAFAGEALVRALASGALPPERVTVCIALSTPAAAAPPTVALAATVRRAGYPVRWAWR